MIRHLKKVGKINIGIIGCKINTVFVTDLGFVVEGKWLTG